MGEPTARWKRLVALAELAGDVDQQDIAERLGYSPSALSKWKKGDEPSPNAVRAAADAYHDAVKLTNDELLRELLRIAYLPDPEEPKKRTPRQPRRRRFNPSLKRSTTLTIAPVFRRLRRLRAAQPRCR